MSIGEESLGLRAYTWEAEGHFGEVKVDAYCMLGVS